MISVRAMSARAAAARVELAHPAGDEVDQRVGNAHLIEGFLAEFGIQGRWSRFQYVKDWLA